MTRKENLRSVLRCQRPAWVPFAPNFQQWWDHHFKFNSLPAELRGCRDYIDAMKALGCDIFSRNVDGGVAFHDTKIQAKVTTVENPVGPRMTTEYETPYGTLRAVCQRQSALTTFHDEEYFVKDWERDGNAFRWLMEQRVLRWNQDVFAQNSTKIGDDGILNVCCAHTPLKILHMCLGLDHTCLFVMDYPELAKELCDLYWQQQVRPVLKLLADSSAVDSVIIMDNVDTPFYAPSLAAEYWEPYVKDATNIMREKGKPLFVHACGKLAGLSEVFARSGVSGLEGISHSPLGDWPVAKAQACHDKFVFVGGFSAQEQEIFSDDEVKAFYAKYLATASKERFIFAASCQTSINTKWERLKLVRDICREWGGSQGR